MNPADAAAAKPKILVFARPFLMNDVRANLAPLASDYAFEYLTDGVYPGVRDTRDAFYSALAEGGKCPLLSAAEIGDVVNRCRLLRNIARPQAERLVHAMAIILSDELDRVRPDAVFGQMVDEYITHLLSLLAVKRSLRFAGYASSYFPDHAQLTDSAYGTSFRFREPGDNEVDGMLMVIRQRAFRQNYSQPESYSLLKHLKRMARYGVKRVVFRARQRIHRDPWNCHFALLPYIVECRHFRDFPRRSYFDRDWNAAIQELRGRRPGLPVVYLPLGYFPESTIDYWIPDKRALRYEDLSLEMVRILARDCIVVVKEHVHMMGGRNTAFLKALREIPNTVNVHPFEFSNDVLAEADAVVLGAGSVGVEATVRGKPVFSYCATSYWFEKSRASELRLGEMESWGTRIRERLAMFQPLSDREVHEFVRDCLRGTSRTRPGARKWPHMHLEDLRTVLDELLQTQPTAIIRKNRVA